MMERVTSLRRFVPGRFLMDRQKHRWGLEAPIVSHEVPAHLEEAFRAAGYESRFFFPHRYRCLPKCGPDGARLASAMCGVRRVGQLWQIVVHATGPAVESLPRELFFDPDITWHGQQFNRVGQVASASLVERGSALYTLAHQSDLVQRISRRRCFKTPVEKTFKGWHRLLLNAIGNFARDRGFRKMLVPTSALAMKHTDAARTVKPELFDRVYDRAVNHHFAATREGQWWSVDLDANRAAFVRPERREEKWVPGRTVCICHDIERGLGHRDAGTWLPVGAESTWAAALEGMLAVERRAGVHATYNVVGCILPEVRERIERDGHCIAFHSYDHGSGDGQLAACRRVDYRIKGYRPPRSTITRELRDAYLCWHNFEWIASSVGMFRFAEPRLVNRLVKIPILFDDFDLHKKRVSYEQWERRALEAIGTREFVAFSLHDCYAEHWLPQYERFLDRVVSLATPRTMDAVAADMFIAAAV